MEKLYSININSSGYISSSFLFSFFALNPRDCSQII